MAKSSDYDRVSATDDERKLPTPDLFVLWRLALLIDSPDWERIGSITEFEQLIMP